MPKLVWVFVAGAFVGERWGWIGMLAVAGFEALGMYGTGFYEAWKADHKK